MVWENVSSIFRASGSTKKKVEIVEGKIVNSKLTVLEVKQIFE